MLRKFQVYEQNRARLEKRYYLKEQPENQITIRAWLSFNFMDTIRLVTIPIFQENLYQSLICLWHSGRSQSSLRGELKYSENVNRPGADLHQRSPAINF